MHTGTWEQSRAADRTQAAHPFASSAASSALEGPIGSRSSRPQTSINSGRPGDSGRRTECLARVGPPRCPDKGPRVHLGLVECPFFGLAGRIIHCTRKTWVSGRPALTGRIRLPRDESSLRGNCLLLTTRRTDSHRWIVLQFEYQI